jgi:hypothetical protein
MEANVAEDVHMESTCSRRYLLAEDGADSVDADVPASPWGIQTQKNYHPHCRQKPSYKVRFCRLCRLRTRKSQKKPPKIMGILYYGILLNKSQKTKDVLQMHKQQCELLLSLQSNYGVMKEEGQNILEGEHR